MSAVFATSSPLSYFLRLPLELREKIYQYLLPISPEHFLGRARIVSGDPAHTEILRTSHQINIEALDVLFRRRTIKFNVYPFAILFAGEVLNQSFWRRFDFSRPKELRVFVHGSPSHSLEEILGVREQIDLLCNILQPAKDICPIEIVPVYSTWWSSPSIDRVIGGSVNARYPGNSMTYTLFAEKSDLALVLQPFNAVRNVKNASIRLDLKGGGLFTVKQMVDYTTKSMTNLTDNVASVDRANKVEWTEKCAKRLSESAEA